MPAELTEAADAPPALTPPRPGVKRTTVLVLYIALIVIGLPVWWRTTAVYRASVPFHLLDKVRGKMVCCATASHSLYLR